MAYSFPPRTLVYKDIKDINYFLGEKSEKTLEREFYNRIYNRPFIKQFDNPLLCILSVFNNTRYIYYQIECEEDEQSLCLDSYLTKAAEGSDDMELTPHIAAATMSLVCSWLCHNLSENRKHIPQLNKEIYIHYDESKETYIKNLHDDIYVHFSKEGNAVTTEINDDFHSLLIKQCDLPTNIDSLFSDIREIEDAAINAPILDVANGIDYLMECYDPQNGTNAEQYFFLCKILKRFENEKSPTNDSKTIEEAVITIKQKIQSLELAPKEEFSHGLSIKDINMVAIEEDPVITPEIKDYIEWINDFKKAPKILKTLRYYMEGKTKPKDLLMPLCAALEVRLIRKTTWKEYKIVFKDHPISSDTSLSNWISSTGMNNYKISSSKTIYNEMLEEFTKIKNSTY